MSEAAPPAGGGPTPPPGGGPTPPAGGGPTPPPGDDQLARAYAEGYAAAERGEEAAPGCTVTPEGRAWLRGYTDGAAARRRP